eukprot:TRINITY_DN1952_c0_g1_i6.p1 TRINITY_DN1952_c0_g1~~TRINITY_DN1952_c0_g1_i6.p1  ORF type:complete len:266 (-),score=28.26 TRINITY_DN1952_c0_g1_i6:148-828(-)
MATTTISAALKFPTLAVDCAPSKRDLPSISSPAHSSSSPSAGRTSPPVPAADSFPLLRRGTTIQALNGSRALNGLPSSTWCVSCSSEGVIGKRRSSSLGRGFLSHCRGVEFRRRRSVVRAMASGGKATETQVEDKLGIRVERNPSEERLKELGVRQWPKWGCPPSKFPWTYDAKETCYLLQGKVYVTPEGEQDSVAIGAGDLVVFPKGMSCTWDVQVAVDKHYNFE